MKNKFPLLLFFLIILAACSDDDTGREKPKVRTGVFLDSEVSGLGYVTQTFSGLTNSAGEFQYLQGEVVTFYVGSIELGSAPASEEMSPVTIASTENATIETPEVMNIAAFLQTLDSDNNPDNGIHLDPAVVEAISVSSIDFTKSIVQLLGEIVAEVNLATGMNLVPVYPTTAAAHLAESLGETFALVDPVLDYFIPTIESWRTEPRTSVHWIHETDASGKLVKSHIYEKNPYRLIGTYTYLSHNDLGQPTSFEEMAINHLRSSQETSTSTITYSQDQRIDKIYYQNLSNNYGYTIDLQGFDELMRITDAFNLNSGGNFESRDVYTYTQDGNKLKRTRFDSPTEVSEANVLLVMEYEYTSEGELAKLSFANAQIQYVNDYFYRADLTKERLEQVYHYLPDNITRTGVEEYNEMEKIVKYTLSVGDQVQVYTNYFENGDPGKVEKYVQGELVEIGTWSADRSSVWKIFLENSAYKLEYRDSSGNVYKTEYYDAAGNLVSTE